jgi:hypothetical protein
MFILQLLMAGPYHQINKQEELLHLPKEIFMGLVQLTQDWLYKWPGIIG